MISVRFLKTFKNVLLRDQNFLKPTISSEVHSRKMGTRNPVNIYEENEEDLAMIEQWLLNYPGGKVNLIQDHDAGIAKIILDHPEKLNAMSGKMMVDLCRAVENLEKWSEGKGVILYGKGKMFCSGGDLDFARATGNAKNGFRMATYMHKVLGRLQNLPLISVAVIHGSGALGGGAEIASSCDWRLMTKDCRGIGFVHSRMGIVPAWGASTRLVSLVGAKRALDLILTAKILTPSEALGIGLVEQIVESEQEAEAWLRDRTRGSAQVVQAAKLTIRGCQERLDSVDQSLEYERRLFAPLWGARANREALNRRLKHL